MTPIKLIAYAATLTACSSESSVDQHTAGASGGAGTLTATGGVLTTASTMRTGGAMATGGSTRASSEQSPAGGASVNSTSSAASGGVPTGGVTAAGGATAVNSGTPMGGVTGAGGTAASGGVTTSTSGGVAADAATIDASSASGGGNTVCGDALEHSLSPCSTLQVQTLTVHQNVLLVVDSSGSMNDKAQPSDSVSKWTSLNSAVSAAMGNTIHDVHYGLELFPYDPNKAIDPLSTDLTASCLEPADGTVAIDIDANASNLTSIVDKLRNIVPAGGTPTAAALRNAYAYFTSGRGAALEGTQWVILLTDGGPNCNFHLSCSAAACTQNIDCKCGSTACSMALNCCEATDAGDYGALCLDSAATLSEVTHLNSAGIKTFVVGLPGSEAYANLLNSVAVAGGVPNPSGPQYYPVDASGYFNGVRSVLQTITSQVSQGCEIGLASDPGDLNQLNVAIDCTLIPAAAPDGGQQNWFIDTSRSPARVLLNSATCEALAEATGTGLSLVTGCPTVVAQRP